MGICASHGCHPVTGASHADSDLLESILESVLESVLWQAAQRNATDELSAALARLVPASPFAATFVGRAVAIAAVNNHAGALNLLLAHWACPDLNFNYERPANPYAFAPTPCLVRAAQAGSPDAVRVLLHAKATLHAADAFSAAASCGFTAVCGILIEAAPISRHAMGFGFREVCRCDFPAMVSLLARSGCSVDAFDDDMDSGERPIVEAAARGTCAVVQALVRCKADVNLCDGNGTTALHAAQTKRTVQVLVRAKALLCAKNSIGATCLHTAARRGSHMLAALLPLSPDMDMVNTQDVDGLTPFHYSFDAVAWLGASDFLASVSLLLEAKADPNIAGDADGEGTPLAAIFDHCSRFDDAFFPFPADNGTQVVTPYEEAVVRLLAARARVTNKIVCDACMCANGHAVTHLIAAKGCVGPVQAAGVLPEHFSNTPLQSAAFSQNPDTLAVLLRHGVCVNSASESIVATAVSSVFGHGSSDRLGVVRLLVGAKASVDQRQPNGQTARDCAQYAGASVAEFVARVPAAEWAPAAAE